MEQLPPDQRAVLSLVLAQGRSYAEVASALGMEEGSVRERAHAALDALAAQDVSAQDRRPLDAPAAPDVSARGRAPSARSAARTGGTGYGSRRAGAVLLAAIAVVAAVVAIVLSSGGKGSPSSTGATAAAAGSSPGSGSAPGSSSAPGSGSSPGSGSAPGSGGSSAASHPPASGAGKATPAQEVHLDKRFTLTPAGTESKASGVGLVVSKGSTRAFYVSTTGLPAPSSGFFYAVWLYNSQSESFPLGRLPTKPEANGSLEGGGPLRGPHLSSFHRLVVTRETSDQPTAPGQIVLSGPFALH